MSKYAASVWFLYRLLLGITTKVIQKYEIDTKDPRTVKYNKICKFVAKATSSKKAIQKLNGKRGIDSSQKHKIKELADQVYAKISIPKKRDMFEASFGLIAMPL